HTSMEILFLFQAEDGIRYWSVTGVQTCALPILQRRAGARAGRTMPVVPYPDNLRPQQMRDVQSMCGRVPGILPETCATRRARSRSEERRVGKECRSRWSPCN